MVALTSHPAYAQSENASSKFNPNGGDAAALISGVWDSEVISKFLGENYGAAKLPTYTVDGKEYKGQGTDYLLVDTYADLQNKLPDGVDENGEIIDVGKYYYLIEVDAGMIKN